MSWSDYKKREKPKAVMDLKEAWEIERNVSPGDAGGKIVALTRIIRILEKDIDKLRARHLTYANGIAKSLEDCRDYMENGEPVRSDRSEIKRLKSRLEAAHKTNDLLHSNAKELQGDCISMQAQLTEATAELARVRGVYESEQDILVKALVELDAKLKESRAEEHRTNRYLTAAYLKLDELDEPAPEPDWPDPTD